MKCRLSVSKNTSLAVLSVILTALLNSARADDEQRIHFTIQKTLASVQKVVDSDLSQEQDLRAAQANLQKLLKTTETQLGGIDREDNSDHPLVISHGKIVSALTSIEARLPHEADELGATRLSPLPVPVFSEHKVVGKAANELNDAQQRLAAQLQHAPSDRAAVEKLLTAVILAQENLAWEVGWPFDAKETAEVKKAGKLTPEVYLSRRGRGVQRINDYVKKGMQSVGRDSTGRDFTIFSAISPSQQNQIDGSLSKQRGEAAKAAWAKGTQKFDPKAFVSPGR